MTIRHLCPTACYHTNLGQLLTIHSFTFYQILLDFVRRIRFCAVLSLDRDCLVVCLHLPENHKRGRHSRVNVRLLLLSFPGDQGLSVLLPKPAAYMPRLLSGGRIPDNVTDQMNMGDLDADLQGVQ